MKVIEVRSVKMIEVRSVLSSISISSTYVVIGLVCSHKTVSGFQCFCGVSHWNWSKVSTFLCHNNSNALIYWVVNPQTHKFTHVTAIRVVHGPHFYDLCNFNQVFQHNLILRFSSKWPATTHMLPWQQRCHSSRTFLAGQTVWTDDCTWRWTKQSLKRKKLCQENRPAEARLRPFLRLSLTRRRLGLCRDSCSSEQQQQWHLCSTFSSSRKYHKQ